jgi:hypothetical protein
LTNTKQEQKAPGIMSNPYAVLKQKKPQAASPVDTKLPAINKQDKAKMGRSMKRRMSLTQNIDISKVIQQQQQKEAQPALPVGILDQYQQQDSAAHQYPGMTQNSLQKGLERQKSARSVRSLGSQRRPSVSSSIKRANRADISDAPPIPAISKPVYSVKGIDLHDQQVIKLLNDPKFDAESFISSRLSDSTATDIERFSSNLSTLNKKIGNDMRSTALKTYDRLVNSSKELESTESELKILRNVIAELLEVSNAMRESAERRVQLELEETSELTKTNSTNGSKATKRRVDRSSVLMLEKIWTNEMNSLFKHVESAQKFISPIPGRHIIAECGRWYELNAATFKTLQPAHIFLLNDLILIATRRRKNALIKNPQKDLKSNSGLIAEQCWPLRDVTLTEIRTNHQGGENSYAIKITYNSLTYIYQTDIFDHYQSILKGYKKARDELRDILDAENIKQKQLRDSLNLLSLTDSSSSKAQQQKQGGGSARNSQILLQDLSTRMHTRSRSTDNSSTLKTLKQIDENLNDVDILIFHENFDDAIEKLNEFEVDLSVYKDRCNEEEATFFNVISMKITLKKEELLKKLINLLNSNTISSNFSAIERIVRSLNNLNQTTIAQILFLNNRSHYLNLLISKIQETKNLQKLPKITTYLIERSIVVFQSLKNSIILYKKLFQVEKSSNLAYLIQWGTKQVMDHLSFLQNKINNLRLSKDDMENLILILHRQSNQLKDVGLNVEYALDEFYKSIDS